MISNENPVTAPLSLEQIDIKGLEPQVHRLGNDKLLYLFPDDSVEILKLDFLFPAGSVYQQKLLVAGATCDLFAQSTPHHAAHEIAEFIDSHGIAMDKDAGMVGATLTLYTLTRHAEALFPLLREMLTEPLFGDQEFAVLMNKRRQSLQSNFQRTNYVARNLFYRALYGDTHPYGHYATPEDVDQVSLEDVRTFAARHYGWQQCMPMLSGKVDDKVLQLYEEQFGSLPMIGEGVTLRTVASLQASALPPQKIHQAMPNAVQSTLRVGRLLPWTANDYEYTCFQVLNTVLGGYFGSRLMSNLREEKGYTYGIYSHVQVMRGSMMLFISADVSGDSTHEALKEIYHELQRLCQEPMPEEELMVVKNYMVGEFMRSIDGIFERSDRWRHNQLCDVSVQYVENFRRTLSDVTSADLMTLAQTYLHPDAFTEVVVGVI